MAGALRRAGLTAALPALVGLSTLLHWLAGRRLTGLWIMPDEAIYAERALDLWRHLALHGAGYGIVYPLVAGLPLSVGSVADGYASLKLLQALVVSLAAAPVFFYGRRWMSPPLALVAAALTLCTPVLLYSGLVMTEVVFYPLAAAALLAVARSAETATRGDQYAALAFIGAAVLTRVQAVVFLAVYACAILATHGVRRRREFAPVWIALAAAVVAALALPGLFGAYSETLHGSYPLGDGLRYAYYHLALALLMVGVAPAAAAILLAIEHRRERAVRAVTVVALATLVLVCAQVGLFSARYAPHLLGRDLAAVPAPLFAAFAMWLDRGAPRRWAIAAATTVATLAALVFAPWRDLVTETALPDSFDLALPGRAHLGSSADAIAILGALLLVAWLAVPRRAAVLVAGLVAAVLVWSSVVASNVVASRVRTAQTSEVGSPRDWIDGSRVTYVYAGGPSWSLVWQQRFWNRSVDEVVSIAPSVVPGPMRQVRAAPSRTGELPITDRHAVAPANVAFVGSTVARQSLGPNAFPLVLWRLAGTPRLSFRTTNIQPNGDMVGPGIVTAYDCRGGSLELTLLPKATSVVVVRLDGRPALRRDVAGLDSWHGTVAVPRVHRSARCVFSIEGGLLLGSTVIDFHRPG